EVGDSNGSHFFTTADAPTTVQVRTAGAGVGTTNDPGDDLNNIYFIDGSVSLSYDYSVFVRLEGSLIANGGVTIDSGGWILAYEERDANPQVVPGPNDLKSLYDYDGNGTRDRGADLD